MIKTKQLTELFKSVNIEVALPDQPYITFYHKLNLSCNHCHHKWQPKTRDVFNEPCCPNCANIPEGEKQTTGLIYLLTSPSGKHYVGQSIDFSNRINSYRTSSLNPSCGQYHTTFGSAIRKYGFDNFQIEVLHNNVPWDRMDQLEIQEIKNYDSYCNGYNQTEGGNIGPRLAQLASERFKKKVEVRKCEEAKKRSEGQQRALTNFEKNAKKELNAFLRSVPSKENELKQMRSRMQRSVETKKRHALGLPKSSKYKGVCWDKKHKKWKANIKHKGKKIHIGLYTNEEAAAKAFDLKAVDLRGDEAKLNFPEIISCPHKP
jgi:group I intron endonuclease